MSDVFTTIDRAIAALDEQRTTIARQALEIARLSADLAAVVAANGLLVARDADGQAVARLAMELLEQDDLAARAGYDTLYEAARAFLASTEAGK